MIIFDYSKLILVGKVSRKFEIVRDEILSSDNRVVGKKHYVSTFEECDGFEVDGNDYYPSTHECNGFLWCDYSPLLQSADNKSFWLQKGTEWLYYCADESDV